MYEDGNVDKRFWQKNMKEAEEKIRLARDIVIQFPKKDLEINDLEKKVNESENFYHYTVKQMDLNNKIIRCHE
jgi:hypothetical protein